MMEISRKIKRPYSAPGEQGGRILVADTSFGQHVHLVIDRFLDERTDETEKAIMVVAYEGAHKLPSGERFKPADMLRDHHMNALSGFFTYGAPIVQHYDIVMSAFAENRNDFVGARIAHGENAFASTESIHETRQLSGSWDKILGVSSPVGGLATARMDSSTVTITVH